MQRFDWHDLLKELPKLVALSFGLAFCALALVSIGATVLTRGSYFLNPNRARAVFAPAFLVALIFLILRRLWKQSSGRI